MRRPLEGAMQTLPFDSTWAILRGSDPDVAKISGR
jgi:hypothetical protein